MQSLFGRLDGKIPCGRCRHRREDTIKMNLQIVEWVCIVYFLVHYRDRWEGGACDCDNEPPVP
jgi:hypothetical protein